MKETIVLKRATVYIVVLGIVCTGLGAVIGATVTKRKIAKELPNIVRGHLLKKQSEGLPFQKGHMGGPGGMARHLMQGGQKAEGHNPLQRIGQALDLTSEQKQEVQAILEGTKQEVTQARDEFRSQVEKVKEKSNAQVLEVLEPEQKEKFQRLTAEMKQREGTKGLRGIR